MSLLDLVKQAGAGAVEAGNPVNILFGTVTKASPLEVNVDQRFTLTEEFFIIPERITRYEVDLKHTHQYTDDGSDMTTAEALPVKIIIRSGLQVGDKVLLCRVQGGQQYVILDKVG